MLRLALFSLTCGVWFAGGCESSPSASNQSSEKAPPVQGFKVPVDVSSGKYDPFIEPAKGDEVVVLDTSAGRIVLTFFPDAAPNHVKNFKDLVKKGFYDGTKFHRTIPGFMVQGGDPNTKSGASDTWGQGGPGYNVPQEFNPIPHKRGILSMARTGDPNGAGSQFFIVVADSNFLDNNYTVFGAVVDQASMAIADKIVQTPTIDSNGTVVPGKAVVLKKAHIEKWPVK